MTAQDIATSIESEFISEFAVACESNTITDREFCDIKPFTPLWHVYCTVTAHLEVECSKAQVHGRVEFPRFAALMSDATGVECVAAITVLPPQWG